ncbi:hypothetical protein KUTeg_012115 [Tegillarca granosa]|uniref:Uncharacterized protein n=1 Tax=Tegillarca granosa TaxID=220873 RepID=A0ABQ9EYL8_TEGGR|nr:hypothetical protein KUTeg_012115 [Tegillarca granosa]
MCTQCSVGCVNGTCRKDNGHCIDGCKATFFGKLCDKSCSANCQTDICDRDTGICEGGCMNANFHDSKCKGPKTNTLFDFWRMVWQEKSGKIVMLTNLIENEKPKCDQYWPDVGQEKDFGSLRVTVENEKEYAFFFERTLQLTNKKTKETRKILQFHFTMWTDHGTPDPVQLMLFHRNVKDAKTDLTGPPVIHCAAGIGRTGTFIALDTLHEYGDKTGKIDVFEYVIKMRKDRMNMIQTLVMYVCFRYYVINDSIYIDELYTAS